MQLIESHAIVDDIHTATGAIDHYSAAVFKIRSRKATFGLLLHPKCIQNPTKTF